MQAHTLTPTEIFGNQVRHVVPLFQRPYVWNEQDQWAPLWEDVARVAEDVLTAPAGYGAPPVAPHFLGAIVLDQPAGPPGYLTMRQVIDGQQRLTTLQLMLNAAQQVAAQHGSTLHAQALQVLVRNQPAILQHPSEAYKVWPTDRDQAAFQAAMDADSNLSAELAGSALVHGHGFFVKAISDWAEVTGDPDKATARLQALTQALRDHLKLVVIQLEPGDNAQVIFESLNSRGMPLLAADLIKNLVFQIAQAQQLDVAGLYRKHWEQLDTDHWRLRVARGRQYVPRIDIFLHHWLITRTIREVPADRLYLSFKEHLPTPDQLDLPALLADLSRDAANYAALEQWPADSAVGRFRYRVLQAMDSAVVTPVLLWLLRWTEQELPAAQRDKALAALESWLVRRALCRLTSKDINRLTLDLLRKLNETCPAAAGDVTEAFLAGQQADSRFWPTDDQVREALTTAPVYRTLLRARLRMVLEAVEEHRRTPKAEQPHCPLGLTIEHLLPQKWQTYWTDGLTEELATERAALLHTIGNLTLVNNKLNPSMSNRPWTDEQAQAVGAAPTGKLTELQKHTTLKINADVVLAAPHGWDVTQIRQRTAEFIERIIEIWPAPAAVAAIAALATAEKDKMPAEKVDETEEESAPGLSVALTGKYKPLTEWLLAQVAESLPVTFDDLETIIGGPLAPSAHKNPAYWYSTSNSLGKAIAAGGYKATRAQLVDETVVLVRR